MKHTSWCRTLNHSDAAKRVYDEYALHQIAGELGSNVGRWFAVAIADGTSDHTLYDSRNDAIRHQHHNEEFYAFVQIVPSQMSVCDAEMFLSGWRKSYEARKRLMPSGKEIIPRLAVEDQRAQIAGLWRNLNPPKGN